MMNPRTKTILKQKTTEQVETYKTKEVEVEYKTCDSCNQDWETDGEVQVFTFHRNPRATKRVRTYKGLNEFIDAGFSSINQMEVEHDKMMQGLGIPIERQLHDVIGREQRERVKADGSMGAVGAKLEEIHSREEDTVLNRKTATLHTFIYEMELPVKTTETKNLCEFCYQGIFD